MTGPSDPTVAKALNDRAVLNAVNAADAMTGANAADADAGMIGAADEAVPTNDAIRMTALRRPHGRHRRKRPPSSGTLSLRNGISSPSSLRT